MFATQRVQKIKDILQKYKSVDIVTLSTMLDVSSVTVRKDLDKLESEGFLIKIHGGACIKEPQEQEQIIDFQVDNYYSKEKIANLALSTIEKGDTIFLGPGSTCYLLAKKIRELEEVYVITNNINALSELVPYGINVFLIAGEVVYKNKMLYSQGSKIHNSFESMFVNKAFISVDGADFTAGFTTNDFAIAALLKQIPNIAKYSTFLIDYSKFNKIGLHHIAPLDFPNSVISNEKLDDTYKQYFFERNIKIITSHII